MTKCNIRLIVLLLGCLSSVRAVEFDAAKLEEVATKEMSDANTPGASIAIVRDGQIVWTKGLGVANVETGQPVTPETLFRLGSTTKMFTAAALIQLAEEGKLKVNAPVGDCIPGLHARIAALTPHQLLTHTAGLTDESIMSGSHDDDALAASIRGMDQSWLFTEPGKIHSYANPGYWIAGLACEVLDGKPYADVMDQRMFRPLGMTRTTLRPTLAMTWPLALGHEIRNGKSSIVRPQADNASTWPAGQIYSNITDLARFTTAFLDGGKLDGDQVLSPTLIASLTSPHVPRPGDDGHYGYGLSVGIDRGVRVWQHGGSRTGYGSTIRLAPDQKIAVIILTNRSAMSLPRTAAAALDMLLPFEPRPESAERSRQPLTEAEIAQLAGSYTNNRQTIVLAVEEGKLIARRRGAEGQGEPNVVTGYGENRLALSQAGVEFFILRDPSGRPEYLISGSRALRRN